MSSRRRMVEAAAVGLLASVGGAAAGSLAGLTGVAAAVAGANGVVSGWRGVYDWSRSTGWLAFGLDSTWSLPMTSAGLFANAVAFAQRDSGYVAELSSRQNRHVHRRGFMPRRGFAITLGNVICGADDVERPRRRRLVTDHENVHCWQARWMGPFFPFAYVGWTVVGAPLGMVAWLVTGRQQPVTKVIETVSYYLNPLEWWAYSRDDHWPPAGKVAGIGPSRPCCRPLSAAADAASETPGGVRFRELR